MWSAYVESMRRDAETHQTGTAKEVAAIQDWLRKNMSMTISVDREIKTIGYFSGTCAYLWSCIVKARRALNLRTLQPKPVMHWIKIVFNVKVVYDIEMIAAAQGHKDLEEHDRQLAKVFEIMSE